MAAYAHHPLRWSFERGAIELEIRVAYVYRARDPMPCPVRDLVVVDGEDAGDLGRKAASGFDRDEPATAIATARDMAAGAS